MFIFRRTYLKCLTETTEFQLDLEQLGLIWQKNMTESFWIVNTVLVIMSEKL